MPLNRKRLTCSGVDDSTSRSGGDSLDQRMTEQRRRAVQERKKMIRDLRLSDMGKEKNKLTFHSLFGSILPLTSEKVSSLSASGATGDQGDESEPNHVDFVS